MNLVFGICEKANPVYGFFHVFLERKSDGSYAKVSDAVKSYPTKGAIWVGMDHALGCPFEIGMYGVFETGDAAPGSSSHFMATRALNDAYQVLLVPYRSTDFEAIREQLHVGLEVQRQIGPKSQILLRFEDDVIAGPFELKNRFDDSIYTANCDDITLHHPKRAWKTLPVQPIRWNGTTLAFHFGELPAAEFLLDYAPSAFSLKVALDHFVAQRKLDGIFSIRKTRDVATHLASLVVPDELRSRTSRLVSTLESISVSAADLEILFQGLRDLPEVKQLLATTIEEAKAAAEAQLHKEGAELKAVAANEKKVIALLNNQKADLDRALDSAKRELASLNEKYAAASLELSKTFEDEITRSIQRVHDTLAQVAVLRPFMAGHAPVATESKSNSLCVTVRNEISQLGSVVDAVERLSSNLMSIGLHKSHARDIAMVVVASLSAGGAVSFRGSMARRTAETVAATCLGREWTRVSVPVGLADEIPVGASKRFLFIGANRSCPDAYAPNVVEACRPGADKQTYAVFDLSEAASALPPSMIFSELGPVIHTDALLWTHETSKETKPGELTLEPIPETKEDAEFKSRTDKLLAKNGNACFRILLSRQMRILPAVLKVSAPAPMHDEAAASESERLLVTWWLLPFLSARHSREELTLSFVESHRNDAAIGRSMGLLFPTSDSM